jgi:predicted TIM-barrel fold metal-dependent hydrolase
MVPHLAQVDHPFARIVEMSPCYMFDELRHDCRDSGHNIVATVFMECHAFYRTSGPVELQPVGEVEVMNGVAARSAGGIYGPFEACAAIVGHADLGLGTAVGAVLDAEIAAGNGRFVGIRHIGAYDADPDLLGPSSHAQSGLYADPRFREGFAELGKRGLTFDAWVLEPQIGEVTALARAFPDQKIVLDHCGTPLGFRAYQGRLDERFAGWQAAIRELAQCPNVSVKLGGLAMPFTGLGGISPDLRLDAQQLADLFRPYVETCVEAFGADRAMFESNYPVDRWGADYATIWDAFKLIAQGVSAQDKQALFAGTAARFYGMEHVLTQAAA